GNQNAGSQIAAYGHDGAVHIPHAQRDQHLFIPGVAHHGIGDAVGDLLHLLGTLVDDHDFVAQVLEFDGQGSTEAAQADDNIGFHSILPFSRSSLWYRHIDSAPPPHWSAGSPG